MKTVLLFLILTLGVINMSHAATCTPVLDHKFKSLQGQPQDLCQYSGKVVLVVNTASYCGYTPQYEGLQALYDKYKNRGLVVLGVPSNEFGEQEPGSNAEIADFCERTYKVKFPMLEKSSVLKGSANPLHEQLAKATNERPQWNFHKYLISRDGKQISSYNSKVTPDSATLGKTIEAMLGSQ